MRPLALALMLLAAVPAAGQAGSLVIAGGGLSHAGSDIHRAFLARRPTGRPLVAIIPSASEAPVESSARFAEALIRQGVPAHDIVVVRLAAEDDPATPHDERDWAGNATNADELAKVRAAGGIWFTGGDQLRTTRLLAPGGCETPLLAAIRQSLAQGAVIGGTSAGAAIMSRAMITEGDPLAALLNPVKRQAEPDNRVAGGGLVLGEGLGFLPQGLVDQHFDARRRLGRLSRALFELPPADRIGFGIDEDTALIVDLATRSARVAGAGGVTLIDARAARRRAGPRFSADAIRLSFAGAGDRIDLATLAIMPAPQRRPIRGTGPSAPVPDGRSGMAVPEPPVPTLLADALFADPGRTGIARPSLDGASGVMFRFTRAGDAAGWSGEGTSLSGILFAIEPLSLKVQP